MSGSTMTISYTEMATRRSRIAEENGAPKWSADAAQKRLASWYSSVMDDEVIRDVASEINDAGAAGADPKIPHVGNVASYKMPVCMAIALADLEAPVVPYDTAEETMALLELRRTLRISGKIMVGEDPRAMVQAIRRQLIGPMLLKANFPQEGSQRQDRGDQEVYPFDAFMPSGSSPAGAASRGGGGDDAAPQMCPKGSLDVSCPHRPRCAGLRSLEDVLAASNKTAVCEALKEVGAKRRQNLGQDEEDDEELPAKKPKKKVSLQAVLGGIAAKQGDDFSETLLSMQRDSVRNDQKASALTGHIATTTHGKMHNQTLEEQTHVMITLKELEHHKQEGTIDEDHYDQARHLYLTQLASLTERLRVLKACAEEGAKAGAQDAFADCLYEEYQQQLHNSREEKVMVDLRAKARKKYKELNEMNAARSLAPLPAILQNMLNSQNSQAQPQWQPIPTFDPATHGKGGHLGKGGGKGQRSGGKQLQQQQWVDGSIYDASLAGIMAPKPGTFTTWQEARMDAPGTEGFIHKGKNWGGACHGCGALGHQFSECEGTFSRDGKTYITWRELYKRGFVDAGGVQRR